MVGQYDGRFIAIKDDAVQRGAALAWEWRTRQAQ